MIVQVAVKNARMTAVASSVGMTDTQAARVLELTETRTDPFTHPAFTPVLEAADRLYHVTPSGSC